MGNKWPLVELSDFVSIKHGFAFKGEYFQENETPDILVTPGNFAIGGGFKSDKYKYYSGPVPNDYVLLPNDLIVTMTDLSKDADTLGFSALVPEVTGKVFLHNQRVGLVVFENQELDKNFLYFLLHTREYRNHVLGGVTGTTVKHTSPTKICSFKFRKPPLNVQKIIGQELLKYELKITLNRQINQTLEQMAQTLFKSWFVDFDPVIDNALDAGNDIPDTLQERAEQRRQLRAKADFKPLPAETRALFPSEFEETELGWVPKGWANYPLSDLIELIGGGTPKTSIDEYWNGSIPWFSVVDAPNDSDVFVLDTEKHISELGLTNSSTRLLRKGTTIISARGTVGKCAVVATPMAMNQSCYGVIGVAGIADEYIYYLIRYSVQQLQLRSHGSVFSTITRDTFKSLQIPFCGNDLTACFSEIVVPLFDKILSNNTQNTKLIELRDALLPKLISGELALDDLPEEIAEAAEAL